MKYSTIIAILLILFLLSGCKNSMKEAKATEVRHETKRRDDIHNIKMADSRALTPIRLATKEVLWWSLRISGSVVIVGGGGALVWLMIGGSINTVRHQRIHKIPLDVTTRQYPLLVYGNGRRAFNPNTGERLLLSEVSEAHGPRIKSITQVQLAGLLTLTDNSKIINEVTDEIL